MAIILNSLLCVVSFSGPPGCNFIGHIYTLPPNPIFLAKKLGEVGKWVSCTMENWSLYSFMTHQF